MLDQPPYIPDLARCDFFLSSKTKEMLKGTNYATEIQRSWMLLMKKLSKIVSNHENYEWKSVYKPSGSILKEVISNLPLI